MFIEGPSYWKPYTGNLTNSEDPDEMQQDAAFHQDLHLLLSLKRPTGTEIHHNLITSTCDPLEYKIVNLIPLSYQYELENP